MKPGAEDLVSFRRVGAGEAAMGSRAVSSHSSFSALKVPPPAPSSALMQRLRNRYMAGTAVEQVSMESQQIRRSDNDAGGLDGCSIASAISPPEHDVIARRRLENAKRLACRVLLLQTVFQDVPVEVRYE